jgi:hypothetical protein
MRSLPTPVLPFAAPHQLSMPFDSGRLRGMNPSDRRMALGRLTRLLLEAAGITAGEHDNDER